MVQHKPSYEAISLAAPSEFDLRCEERLVQFMAEAVPTFSEEEQHQRMHILSTITNIFEDWVRSVCLSKGLPPEVANAAGGMVFTSGSYRLNIAEKGMDIDTICVAPRQVTRDDFFDSLKAILEDHDSITNLTSVETAQVPLITFDFEDINIDLLFASLPVDSIPKDFDINDDNVLRGVDSSTEKTLNGPRVTNLIKRLVPNFPSFLKLVRCVRLWAKRRGLYSNKMGYLGGVNCNILAAFICQLYPNASASVLLERFFYVLRDWKWPTPILLTPISDAGLGFDPWDPSFGGNRFHVMPILTPAYPAMNSTVSVSRQTLEVMQGEMAVALDKVRAVLANNGEGWADVFAPTDFSIAHSRYLAAEIFVSQLPEHEAADKARSWCGYCESRLRKLVETLSYLPISNLRLLPKKLPLLTVKSEAEGGPAQGGEGMSYLIGFDIDKARMQGSELDLTNKVEGFKMELYAGAARPPPNSAVRPLVNEEVTHKHLRFRVSDFPSWRALPEVCFEGMGGKASAKAAYKVLKAARKAEMALYEGEGEGGGDDAAGADGASADGGAGSARGGAAGDSSGTKRAREGKSDPSKRSRTEEHLEDDEAIV
jgi:poly(A) polymerase